MSQHKSLVITNYIKKKRNVIKRCERLKILNKVLNTKKYLSLNKIKVV
ncbi:small basic protein [Candidatus Pinguicoccus supinus]|uniref:Small basic protein n=1 Tax=Candidatus Pinguicoccus supinus TaxID=2529394 RepID=A0A7T0FY98_9BACT|nr:small basic protein [Candidatus Pinguicoccus supinus]